MHNKANLNHTSLKKCIYFVKSRFLGILQSVNEIIFIMFFFFYLFLIV